MTSALDRLYKDYEAKHNIIYEDAQSIVETKIGESSIHREELPSDSKKRENKAREKKIRSDS